MANYFKIRSFTLDLKPGDQIAIQSLYENLHESLKHLYLVISSTDYYYHHGMYIGNHEVVHFYGETSADACPCKVDLWEFSKRGEDRELYRVDHKGEVLPVNDTLQKAEEVLVNKTWPQYDIVHNNCETLATWLKTGKKMSYQAREAVIRGATNIAAVVVASARSIATSISMSKK